MITTFDKKDLKNLTRYVYVPWPHVQNYRELDDYGDHSISDIMDDGACIEEDWLYEHTPDHEGCSYEEVALWGNAFDNHFDLEGLQDDDIDDSIREARLQFISEMESGEVCSIEEFCKKYNLD